MATSNYSWNLPTVGGSEDTWGTSLNANWTALDTLLGGTNATEFAILDGATVTTVEFNYLSGVTSGVQGQFNAITSRTISAGAGLTGGGDLSASRTISHADTSSQGSVDNSGTTFIQDITLDTYGHVTGIGSATVPAGIGDGQTWQAVSRSTNTSYQNTTGKPIMFVIAGVNNSYNPYEIVAQVSTDNSSWVSASQTYGRNWGGPIAVIVPNGHYYRQTGLGQTGDVVNGVGWVYFRELR
jgi:hypothetical protein